MAAASYSRCVHVFKKFQGLSIFSESRRHAIVNQCQRSYVSTTGNVPKEVLQSRATEFAGEKIEILENPEVQTILRRLTGFQQDRIFKARKEPLKNPIYKVMDKEELKKVEEEIEDEAKKRLVMPPVMTKRSPIKFILSEDKELIDHDEDGADFVFTDISMSKDYRTCAVLVRENATGILRDGSWDERDRMQYIYWPKEGQRHEIIEMLQDEHLPTAFSNSRHVDVLDFVNIQCEPDSPDYIRVCHRVYEDLDARKDYDILYSTRHFSGMVFHLVNQDKSNLFFSYLIRNSRLDDAVDLVKLHLLIHPDSDLSKQVADLQNDDDIIKCYISFYGLHNLTEYLDLNGEKTSVG